MAFVHRVFVEGSYMLSGDPSGIEQLLDRVRGDLQQVDPDATVKVLTTRHDLQRELKLSASVPIGGNDSDEDDERAGMVLSKVLRLVGGHGRAVGLAVSEPPNVRRTTFRLQNWLGRIRLGGDIDFTWIDSPSIRPDGVEQGIYPGAELKAAQRRAQIWAVEWTHGNLGMGAFAGYDAYLVEVEVEDEPKPWPAWIPARYCSEIPQTDARVLVRQPGAV